MTDEQRMKLLRPVARSFSINLRLLPAAMREPLGLAYLLARLSDTVADAPGPPTMERHQLLLALHEEPLRVSPDSPGFPGAVTPGEMHLLQSWGVLRQDFGESKWRAEIASVWRRILEGQLLDSRRALDGTSGDALSWAEVIEYCDAVAGSVGFFWHEVGRKLWADWSLLDHEAAYPLARDYGRALQLLNICRDSAADAAAGRVYLAHGDYSNAVACIRAGLEGGECYAFSLRSWRLRWATILPAALGKSLLPLLASNPTRAKLTRRRIRTVLLRSLWRSRRRRLRNAQASGMAIAT